MDLLHDYSRTESVDDTRCSFHRLCYELKSIIELEGARLKPCQK
jgi:hypothetical protein